MRPLLIANHPAIDFLNTAYAPDGVDVEVIGDGKSFLGWLVATGLLDQTRAAALTGAFSLKALDKAAAEAREIREWARDWLRRWRVSPGGKYEREIGTLNELLSRAIFTREVIKEKNGIALADHPKVETPDALIALVAMQLALLITNEDAELLKECAGVSCTLWFLDQSKAHRRLFCSPAVCGNRAKVAAFRERQRG